MSKSLGLILGPVLYHPTMRSLALTLRNIPYLSGKGCNNKEKHNAMWEGYAK